MAAGVFALVCAAAALAGVFRSAISLVVLVVEGTRGINFLFGIITAVVVANFVAGGQDGIYESEIERDSNVYFLRHDAPRVLTQKVAKDIMVRGPVCFDTIASVARVLETLQQTSHHGFPVVVAGEGTGAGSNAGGGRGDGEGPRQGHLEGLVLRSQLLVLLKEKCAAGLLACSGLLKRAVLVVEGGACSGVSVLLGACCECARCHPVCARRSQADALMSTATKPPSVACRAFCDRQGRTLSQVHLTSRRQFDIERRMRLFYRMRYTHHRYLATQDQTAPSLASALENTTLQRPSARRSGSGTLPVSSAPDGGSSGAPPPPLRSSFGSLRLPAASMATISEQHTPRSTGGSAVGHSQNGALYRRLKQNVASGAVYDGAASALQDILANIGSTDELYLDLRCANAEVSYGAKG